MKKAQFRSRSQPTVRILLVAPDLYQVSLFNVKGYLRNLLLDRCKKVGAEYRYFEGGYIVDSKKLPELQKDFQDLLQKPNLDPDMKFRIEDVPMANLFMMKGSIRSQQSKSMPKKRVIFIDRFSENRYFYARKRVLQIISPQNKEETQKQLKIMVILTSEINKKLWTSTILAIPTTQVKQQFLFKKVSHQVIDLTFSELTKHNSSNSPHEKLSSPNLSNDQSKLYILTYDNLKFVEGSWFLAEMRKASLFLTDDAEYLISLESQLATLESKKRNFEAYKKLMKNYGLEKELIIFLSKYPEPCDIQNLMVLSKPKSFTGIKPPASFDTFFNEQKLKPEEIKAMQEFGLWFKKRYRWENKCFKEIHFLLNNILIEPLETVFTKNPNTITALELPFILSQHYQIHLLESPKELRSKFDIMDKKYKKQCPNIDLKKIMQGIHDKQKSQMSKFQVTSKLEDHLVNKNSKNFFFEARELILNSKIDFILRKIFFIINVQKQRIVIVVEDERLQKKVKKYFKETQIEYFEYTLRRSLPESEIPEMRSPSNSQQFSQFDAKLDVSVCILNISQIFKSYKALTRERRKIVENQYEDDTYVSSLYQENDSMASVPKIATAGSIHFIEGFWYEFNFEKELLLSRIFSIELSFIEEVKQQKNSTFREIFKKSRLPSHFYLFEGSNQKLMLEMYLQRKQELSSFKQEPITEQGSLLTAFVNQMISEEMIKYENFQCPVIDYVDIDEEFDKIEEEAKKIKNSKGLEALEEKVFLPKFTKPQNKSFKELIEERLNLKNIDQILEESDGDLKEELQTMPKPQKNEQEVGKQLELKDFNENFLSEYLLPSFPQIKPDTIRLDSKQFEQATEEQNPLNFDDYEPTNEPEQDLFDKLLAPQIDNLIEKDQKCSQQEEAETESECDEDKNLKRLKKVSQTEAKTKPKYDDSILFQNYGSMIYHKHDIKIETKTQESKIEFQSRSEKSVLPQSKPSKWKTEEENSIEIISPDEVIDVQKMSEIKPKRLNKLEIQKMKKPLKGIIKQQAGSVPFYGAPKTERLSGKKFYEEAISKSKQLWEKKLRKEKETIILAPKKLELSLVPKTNWREDLTEEEKAQLREKGIDV